MQARKLYLDTTARTFVADPSATLPLPPPLFFEGDVENIELYFLEPTGNFSAPYDFVNYSSGITATLKLGATTASATGRGPKRCGASVSGVARMRWVSSSNSARASAGRPC